MSKVVHFMDRVVGACSRQDVWGPCDSVDPADLTLPDFGDAGEHLTPEQVARVLNLPLDCVMVDDSY